MNNPFVYGEVVPQAAFVDRETELDRLTHDLLAGQKIFLISPRRYGKSSLVRQALGAAARSGVLTVDVTVSSYSSYVAFLEGYARALLGVETRIDKARAWLREMLGAVRPEVRVEADETGTAQLALSFPSARTDKDVSRLAQEVFALPGRIAAMRRRRMAVALDEFQAIGSFNGGSVEHALRAAVQHQRDVGYVFSGSEPSLMERMLGRSRPFYKAGPVMRLQKIPADRFADFIESRLRSTRLRPATRRGDRRTCRQPALRCAASRARGVGRCSGWEGGGRRRSARDAEAAARRARCNLRSRVATADAGAACGSPQRGARRWPGAAFGRRTRTVSARRPIDGPGLAVGARARRPPRARRRTLRGRRLADARMGRAQDALRIP